MPLPRGASPVTAAVALHCDTSIRDATHAGPDRRD